MQLQENTLFANRYQLIKLLGRGGFSEVWLAKDNWTHLQIAIKVYAPGQGMDQDGLQDFCGELASVYDLNHSNLLKPQHVDTWENMPYLIMAYCPAGSCVKRVGKMTEAELWKLIHDVAAGLAYLHEKDVIHQDIKPDNILIDTEGNYLITDFGISARARSTLRKSVIGGNTSGGTTAYMGPERFSRQPAPTKASDIWSFGAMAFELLEGVTPFGEIGGGMQKGGAEIPFINAPVSDALKYTIFKMLSKETWDRPTSATLVEWASNPSSIEIDYSLLSEEGSSAQAQSVPASVAETPTPQPEGRATQRFNNDESITDVNSTISISLQHVDNNNVAEHESKASEEQKQKELFKKLCMVVFCVAVALFGGILQGGSGAILYFVMTIVTSVVGLILYLTKWKKVSFFILALSIGFILIPSYHKDVFFGFYTAPEEYGEVYPEKTLPAVDTTTTATSQQNTTKTYNINKNAIQAVDLGLSVKWGSCNLGANKPHEYGYYYAWGETSPKGKYTWDTYQYCKGTEVSLTKYNSLAAYGKIDRKTVLEFSDDAVSTNLGSSWRIPTEKELSELLNNCTWKWTTINGVHGYIVTSKKQGYTNNSIFIPAAGFYDGSDFLNAENSYGNYFSSSLDNSVPNGASFLAFHPNGINIQCCYRYYGLSIRPVYKSRASVVISDVKTNTSTATISKAIDKISIADRKILDASIQNAKNLLDNQSADAYMDRPSQKTEVRNLLNQKHLPIVESELLNLKQVKSIQISNYGIFEYSYFNCKFTSKNGSIYYKKTTGSQRQNGFLYRKDTNTVYFAGAWSVNDDPTKEYGSDQSIVGIFYKLSSGKYIMIMGDDSGVNILLFK